MDPTGPTYWPKGLGTLLRRREDEEIFFNFLEGVLLSGLCKELSSQGLGARSSVAGASKLARRTEGARLWQEGSHQSRNPQPFFEISSPAFIPQCLRSETPAGAGPCLNPCKNPLIPATRNGTLLHLSAATLLDGFWGWDRYCLKAGLRRGMHRDASVGGLGSQIVKFGGETLGRAALPYVTVSGERPGPYWWSCYVHIKDECHSRKQTAKAQQKQPI